MKFTVCIPVWNQSQYLDMALRSVLDQTYRMNNRLDDVEIIVVNDGSPDNFEEVIRKYDQDYIKVIRQVNKGLASARNAAIMNMTGDYFFPLDADDIMFPNCLQMIADEIEKTHADVIAPSLRCFNEQDSQDTIIMPSPKLDDFKEGNRLPYCCAIKKEALLEVGGYSPRMDNLGGWEDLHMWYDLMTRDKKIVAIKVPLVMYRVKENSMWKDAAKNKDKLWDQIIKDFPEVASHRK